MSHPTVRTPPIRLPYQSASAPQHRRGAVEREMVNRSLAVSENAAGIKLARLRAEMGKVCEVFVAVGALDRLEWFIEPTEVVLQSVPAEPLTPDLVAGVIAIDGEEDGGIAKLLAHLADPKVALQAVREARAEMAAKRRLIRAVNALHGWV